MEYFVYHIDEYQPLKKGNEFSPLSPFRMIVAGSSDSGKTNMVINLLIGTKRADKENGSRYILCNDVVLFAKYPDEPKWNIVRDFYNEISKDPDSEFYEDVSFKVLPYSDIPDPETFDPSRSTVAIFEDLMHEPKKTQDKIAQYFTHGRHRNISVIYVAQRFFAISKTMRDNISYISLHRGGGNLSDIRNIISRYTEHSDRLAPKIDELTLKREFIIFDLRRPRSDPLSIRIRWDSPLDEQSSEPLSHISDNSINVVDAGNKSFEKELEPLNKFSTAGLEAIAQAKKDTRIVEFAGKLPLPSERRKLLATGVKAKNSDTWARLVYREAFGIRDKDLGARWREFTQKIKESSEKQSFDVLPIPADTDKKTYLLRYKTLLDSRPLDEKKYIEGCEILTWLLSNSHIDQKTYRVGIRELSDVN
jgi:hypothetical protein